jgi:hypothetical protein
MDKEAFADEAVLGGVPGSVSASLRLRSAIKRYWHWAAVAALAVLLWAPRLTGPIDLRWDGGVYYLLGTSLRTGHGYRIASEPGFVQAVQYPPLLPAVVAMHEWALSSTDPKMVAPWLRVSYALLFVMFGVAALGLARLYLRPWFAIAAAGLCLIQVMTVFLSDLLFAELPFGVISTVFALVARNGAQGGRAPLREIGSFALAAASFLLRTAGIALLAAWVIEGFIRRRWRLALIRLSLMLIPILAWQSYIATVRASKEYTHPAYPYQRAPYQYSNVSYAENALLIDPFRPELGRLDAGALATRLTSNVRSVLLALGEAVSAREGEWERLLAMVEHKLLRRSVVPLKIILIPIFAFSALVVWGLFVFLRRRAWLTLLIIFASLGLIWATPWPVQFNRYLMPLSPFLAISAVLGLSEIDTVLRGRCAGWAGRPGQVVVPGILVLMFALESFATVRLFHQRASPEGVTSAASSSGTYRLFAHSRAWQDWENAADWIEAHAPASAIVATMPSHFCYLLTGRLSILPPMDLNPSRVRELLDAVPVSYVIVDQIEFPDLSRRYALPAVRSEAARWHLVYSLRGTGIYENIAMMPRGDGQAETIFRGTLD